MGHSGKLTHYLVIDVETTSSDDGSVPKKEREIIEIGAVLVDAHTLNPVDEFQSFVRPVRHPVLTEFCRTLTTITQMQVDQAPTFPAALEELCHRMIGEGVLFCSWGDFDRHQFRYNCEYHGIAYPFGKEHLNLKRAFSEAQGTKRRLGMAQALRRVGLPLEGTHHRGIDDARNIVRLLPYVVGRKN